MGDMDDAVRADPEASYERARAAAPLGPHERVVVDEQLGRPSRGRSAVVHRCEFGLPTVLRVDPRLDDDTPFPTTFWLTCPLLNAAIGTLEADKAMVAHNDRLARDPEFAAAYDAAQQRLIAFRDELGDGTPLPGNPTAGGKTGHVKCLHTHAAQFLATGDNVVGAQTISEVTPMPCPGPCAGPERVAP